MLRSILMSGVAQRPLSAPDGPAGGGAPGAAAEEPAAPAAAAPAAPAEAVAPAGAEPSVAPAAGEPGAPAAQDAPAADAKVGDAKTAEAKPADAAAAAGAKPGHEFPSSLLDEAAKPTAEAKPGDAAPAKDAAKPADAKPSDKKVPAADAAKPGDKSAKDLAADAKPAEPPAPIEYAFTYPDGIKPEDVNPERLDAFTGILNEVRAPPDVGQKLLDLHLGEVTRVAQEADQRALERQWDVFANQQKDWREQVMADPELGGARHATAIKTVMGLIDAFSLRDQDGKNPRSADTIAAERKELLDVARTTGAVNNPTFLRLLHWAGENLAREGKPRPAPPPRQQPANSGNRGLRRYQGTTPATS